MKTVRIVLALASLGDAALALFALSILEKMTGNPDFPGAIPQLDGLKKASANYEAARLEAVNRGKDQIKLKNLAREELKAALRAIAAFVESVANNDEGIITRAGFDIRKRGELSAENKVDKPEDVTIISTEVRGTVKVSSKKIDNAKMYAFQYRLSSKEGEENNTAPWTTVNSTKRSIVVEGLEPGKFYAFRVGGLGRGASVIYSDAVTRMI
jgi:hypothetical protein